MAVIVALVKIVKSVKLVLGITVPLCNWRPLRSSAGGEGDSQAGALESEGAQACEEVAGNLNYVRSSGEFRSTYGVAESNYGYSGRDSKPDAAEINVVL